MENIGDILIRLVENTGLYSITYKNVLMILVACFFLYLAIRWEYEPLLLVPIAFGMLLVNLFPGIMAPPPPGGVDEFGNKVAGGLLYYFFLGDELGIWPSLIFLGVGALTDFGPLIARPSSFLMGVAAQFGVFAAFIGALLLGFEEGAAAAYSYMALVPIIQPPIMRALQLKKKEKLKWNSYVQFQN